MTKPFVNHRQNSESANSHAYCEGGPGNKSVGVLARCLLIGLAGKDALEFFQAFLPECTGK